jgi:gliding motility-associated-like protein
MRFILSAYLLITAIFASAQQTTIQFSAASNNTTVSTCDGFIIDSGGQGGSGYGNNENTTITICPDSPGNFISVVFNLFQLSLTDDVTGPNVNVDYMDIFDGPNATSPSLGTYTGSELQGVVIHATSLNTTGCITIRFRSNTTGTGMFTASATCEIPCDPPTAAGIITGTVSTGGTVTPGETQDSILVCVGETVKFDGSASFASTGFNLVNYKWDFMNGDTVNGSIAEYAFNEPGQYLVQLFVTDDNGCKNNNLIDLQVFVGTIPNFTGFIYDTTICTNETINFAADPEAYEVTWTGFDGEIEIDNGCISDDMLGVSQNTEIMQTGFAPGSTITNPATDLQSICIDMEHSFMGDLVLMIVCPNGQSQILHQQGGGGTQIGVPNPLDNIDCTNDSTQAATQGTPLTYCFTPTATQTWVQWVTANGSGLTIPSGDYAPVQPFSNLVGCPLNGIWTLTVIDNWAADDGTVFGVDLNFDPAFYPPVTQFEPAIGLQADSSYWATPASFATISPDGDSISISPTTPGSYQYTYNLYDNFGCHFDSTITVTVNEITQPYAGVDTIACFGVPLQLNGSLLGSNTSCEYSFHLMDSYTGLDGWNGNHLLITINGVQSSYTIGSGNNDTLVTLSIENGTNFTVQFDGAGGFLGECSYEVLYPDGSVQFSDGITTTAPSTTIQNLTANCFSNYVFAWTPATILNDSSIANPIASFENSGTMTLTVYPIGHPDCAATDQFNFSTAVGSNPGHDSTLSICSSGIPQDLFPLLGPDATPGGVWKNAAGTIVTMPYDPLTMDPGAYKYELSANGCVTSAIVTVTEITVSYTTVEHDITCNSANNGSISITSTNATQYSIDNGPFQFITSSPFTLSNLDTATHQVVIENSIGCFANFTFSLSEPQPLSITSLSPDITICPDSTTTLNVTATGGSSPYIYTWLLNGTVVGNNSTITVDPTVSNSEYVIQISEECGSPIADSSVTITFPTSISPSMLANVSQACTPGHFEFTNNSNNSSEIAATIFTFSQGTTNIEIGADSTSISIVEPGSYSCNMTVTSIYGCVYNATFPDIIKVTPLPTADFIFSTNPATFFETAIQMQDRSSSDVTSWEWISGESDPSYSNAHEPVLTFPEGEVGEYPVTLKVQTAEGCEDTITRILSIISDIIYYAPNSFTPDNDEHNQSWRLYVDGIDPNTFNLKIFNRWGEIIWESNNPESTWDGTYNNSVVPAGTYVWRATARDAVNDGKHEFSGYIYVMR